MTRQFKVTVNGREYDVSVLEVTPGHAAAAAGGVAPATAHAAVPATAPSAPAVPVSAPAAATPAAGEGDVLAGMGGVVVEVHVSVGQSVAAGDRLLVLEAMKMKTPVVATRAGQVTRVLVAAHAPVEAGQVLVTIA